MRLFVLAIGIFLFATSTLRADAPETVAHVDLQKYLGVWYEIARLPHPKQEGCYATTATYSQEKDGRIGVLNQCRRDYFEGDLRSAKGTARVVDSKTNSKLEVQFFWPFWGDYWILALDGNYRYALIGEPKRRYLWILSRVPTLEENIYRQLMSVATKQGYDLSKLSKTPQLSQKSLPNP